MTARRDLSIRGEEPVWLSRTLLDVVHADLIAQHGGSTGVRDDGLIESALARPQNTLAYGGAVDLAALAAAYAVGLAKNHGYIDGNKRIAFMAMYVFLGINGVELDAPEPEVVRIMTDVATGAVGEAEMAVWIRENAPS